MYACDQCDFISTQRNNLLAHIKFNFDHEATKNESSTETFQIKTVFMDDHVSVQL